MRREEFSTNVGSDSLSLWKRGKLNQIMCLFLDLASVKLLVFSSVLSIVSVLQSPFDIKWVSAHILQCGLVILPF